jgi:hypothetical protein
MTALERLPLVMAALDAQLPTDCHGTCKGIEGVQNGNSVVVVTSPGYDHDRQIANMRGLAALRNALPGLIDAMKMLSWWACNGISENEAAQSILDAIQQAVTPETWAAITKE